MQIRIRLDNKKNRIVTFLICICFFTILILGTIYEAKESDHSCSGDNCPICAHIQQIENTIRQFSTAINAVGSFVAFFIIFVEMLLLYNKVIKVLSPVELRVRMNN